MMANRIVRALLVIPVLRFGVAQRMWNHVASKLPRANLRRSMGCSLSVCAQGSVGPFVAICHFGVSDRSFLGSADALNPVLPSRIPYASHLRLRALGVAMDAGSHRLCTARPLSA